MIRCTMMSQWALGRKHMLPSLPFWRHDIRLFTGFQAAGTKPLGRLDTLMSMCIETGLRTLFSATESGGNCGNYATVCDPNRVN